MVLMAVIWCCGQQDEQIQITNNQMKGEATSIDGASWVGMGKMGQRACFCAACSKTDQTGMCTNLQGGVNKDGQQQDKTGLWNYNKVTAKLLAITGRNEYKIFLANCLESQFQDMWQDIR